MVRLGASGNAFALKIARPDGYGAGGLAAGLTLDERNELIRREVRARRLIADLRQVRPVVAAGKLDHLEYFASRWIETDVAPPSGSSAALTEVAELAWCVSALHARGVAHNDLEPGHVLRAGGHVYLVDFGSAVLRGEVSASRWAKAIERDLFSLGCILADLLVPVGRFPYRQDGELEAACDRSAWLTAQSDDPLAHVARRALAARVGRCPPFRDAAELARALREALARTLERERPVRRQH